MKKENHPIVRLFEPLVDSIVGALETYCEVVLHDFSYLKHSIVNILNGYITGRKVRDPITGLGLKTLKSEFSLGRHYTSYMTKVKNG